MIDLFRPRHSLPMVYQTETGECGLACLNMLAVYYGDRLTLRELRRHFNLSTTGSSIKHLLEAGHRIRLAGRPLRLELDELGKLQLPAILHWDFDHFVVLKKLNARQVTIHDPARGIRRYRLNELGSHFTGVAVEFVPTKDFTTSKIPPAISFKHLLQFSPGFVRTVFSVFTLSLLLQLLALLSPLYLQLVIDQGLAKGDGELVFLVAILFFLVMVARHLVGFFRGVVVLRLSSQLGYQLASNTFHHLLRLPLGFFEKREMGDIVSRFSSLDRIRQLLTEEVITVVVDGVFSLVTLLLLFIYDSTLAWIALGFVTAVGLLRVLAISAERMRRQEVLLTEATQQTRFMENVRHMAVIKSYRLESQRLAEWQGEYAAYINRGYHLGRFQLGLNSLQGLLFGLDQTVTVYLGAQLVIGTGFTLGQLMGFVFLKQHFSNSVTAMLPRLVEIRLIKLELERVSDIALAVPEPVSPELSLLSRRFQGQLSVRKLSFRWSDADPLLIQNLSVEIPAHSSLAITGPSGSGKSTLLKLLLGLEQAESGSVLIDGITLQDFGVALLREHTATVMHDDSLLAGDLAYNINLDVASNDQERMLEASRRAGILDVIEKLPMGFATRVGEMGCALSTGQVQRVLLARALYRRPRLLLLDEGLSHLPREAALPLLDSILSSDMTVVFVTHDVEQAAMADQRLVLECGR